MKKYTQMFLWENQYNLNTLIDFRRIFHEYIESFKNDNPKSEGELRSLLVTKAPTVERAMLSVSVPHWMTYGSNAIGYRQMSITHEIPEFVRGQYSMLGRGDDTLAKIDDMYLRAIGIYQSNRIRSVLNTLNPFLYINAVIRLLFVPIFTILDVKPEGQEKGLWHVLQVAFRIPAYYVTVVRPIIELLGGVGFEKVLFETVLNIF